MCKGGEIPGRTSAVEGLSAFMVTGAGRGHGGRFMQRWGRVAGGGGRSKCFKHIVHAVVAPATPSPSVPRTIRAVCSLSTAHHCT